MVQGDSIPANGVPVVANRLATMGPGLPSNALWRLDSIGEVPDVGTPLPVTITTEFLQAAKESTYLRRNLLIDPAAMFDTAGYPLTPDKYSEFNEFYRSHAGVQAVHAALEEGRSLESVADWRCTVCEVGMWIIAVAIVSLAGIGAALLGPTAGPIVALATYLGVSNAAAAAFVAGVIAGGLVTVDKLLGKICEWTGVCGAPSEIPNPAEMAYKP